MLPPALNIEDMSEQDKLDSADSIIETIVTAAGSLVASEDIESIRFAVDGDNQSVVIILFKPNVPGSTIDATANSLTDARVMITVNGTPQMQPVSNASREEDGSALGDGTAGTPKSSTNDAGAIVGVVAGVVLLLLITAVVYNQRTARGDEVRSGSLKSEADFIVNMNESQQQREPAADEFFAVQHKLQAYGAGDAIIPQAHGGANKYFGVTTAVPVLDLSTGEVRTVDRSQTRLDISPDKTNRLFTNDIVYGTADMPVEAKFVAESTNDIGGLMPGVVPDSPIYASAQSMTRYGSRLSTMSNLSNLEALYSAAVEPQSPGWTEDGKKGISRRVSALSLC